MEGTNPEDGDPSKQSKKEERKQRQKSVAMRNPSQPKRKLKLSLSRIQHLINEEKQAREMEGEKDLIDECYNIVGPLFKERPKLGAGDNVDGQTTNQ